MVLTNGGRDGARWRRDGTAGQETKAIETIDDSKPTFLSGVVQRMLGINCCNMVMCACMEVAIVMVTSMVIPGKYWSAEELYNN